MFKVFLILNFVITFCLSQFLISNTGPCACDLTPNICDIGCCCDLSCSNLQNQSFSCPNALISPASYGCLPSEILFGNNTSFNINNDGNQICIYRDNYTLRNFYYAPNITIFVTYIPLTATAPIGDPAFYPNSVFNISSYSVGSAIYTLEPGAYTGFLSMPRAGANGICADGIAIQYLVSESIICQRIMNIATDCPNQAGMNLYYRPNLLVANFPVAMINQFNLSSALNASGNFTSPTYVCSPSPCSNVVPSIAGTICNNVVTSIVITITGEAAITAVTIALNLSNVASTYNVAAQIIFNKSGYNASAVQNSGNPGYLSGRPVISYYPNNLIRNWVLPAGGDCGSTTTLATIMFGFSGEYDCSFSLTNLNTSAGINNLINTTLSRNWPSFVAPFGNMATFSADWVPVVVENNNLSTSAPNSFPLLTKQSIYILYARNGTMTLPQNEIVGVKINNTFTDVAINTNQLWVTISVVFVDVSQPAYDVNAAVIRRRSGRSVMDFLYLFYVENGALPSLAVSQWRVLEMVTAVIVAHVLLRL